MKTYKEIEEILHMQIMQSQVAYQVAYRSTWLLQIMSCCRTTTSYNFSEAKLSEDSNILLLLLVVSL